MKKSILVLFIAFLGVSFSAQAQLDKIKNAVKSPAGQMAVSTLLSLAQQNPKLSKFVGLVQMAGLTNMLTGSNANPVTLLAPSNSALEAIAPQITTLSKPENKADLVNMVKNHIVTGNVPAANLSSVKETQSLNGDALTVGKTATGGLTVGGANVVESDLKASNGTVHIIDKVLLPADKR
jgi:uncharacterized surface protein with fasciclin (FAS1) repeats